MAFDSNPLKRAVCSPVNVSVMLFHCLGEILLEGLNGLCSVVASKALFYQGGK